METPKIDRIRAIFVWKNDKHKMEKFFTWDEAALEAGYDIPGDKGNRYIFMQALQRIMRDIKIEVREQGGIFSSPRVDGRVRYGYSVELGVLKNNRDRELRRVKNAAKILRIDTEISKNLLPPKDHERFLANG